MRNTIRILSSLGVLLTFADVSRAAGQRDLPGGLEPAIQRPQEAGSRRDGMSVGLIPITDDPDHVKINSEIELTAVIKNLTAEKLQGKRVAWQFINGNAQRKVIWIEIPKKDVGRPRIEIKTKYKFCDTGSWTVHVGLVDPIKHEWWIASAAICSVK